MIRYLASLILSLALVCSQASAGFLLNPYAILTVQPPTLTFLQCSTTAPTGSNPYTFTSQNVGTASADRYTLVAVNSEDGATVFGVNSLTVGGDAATEIADYAGASALASSAIYILANPAGTSESVQVTFSEAVTSSSICIWSVTGLQSATATDTATGGSNNNSVISLNIDLSDYGIGVAGCGGSVDGSAFTWSGFTERADASANGSVMRTTAADYSATSAETNKSVSADAASTGESGCAAATFR